MAIGSKDGYFVIADRSKDLIKSGESGSLGRHGGAIMAIPGVSELRSSPFRTPSGSSDRSPAS